MSEPTKTAIIKSILKHNQDKQIDLYEFMDSLMNFFFMSFEAKKVGKSLSKLNNQQEE